MPYLSSISIINFKDRISQTEVRNYAEGLFAPSFPNIQKIMGIFDNTEIQTRNFCYPLKEYIHLGGFGERNDAYIRITLDAAVEAVEQCIQRAGITGSEVTDLIFVSSTGLATPSLDALLMHRMKLNPYLRRTPIFGLGCAGGVAAMAKANAMAMAEPKAVVLTVVAELCSLTFLKSDYTKSNFVASSLFSDGVAAFVVKGDEVEATEPFHIGLLNGQSHLYPDSVDVMGWDFRDEGFRVLFSQDIPTIIRKEVKPDIEAFLHSHSLALEDISEFIFHPGGKKVLTAYLEALNQEGDFLENTRIIMQQYGNMSSATVLYVLERCLRVGFKEGYGLMAAMGPGFSSELFLLDMKMR